MPKSEAVKATDEKRREIIDHLKAFFDGIKALAEETHGSERVLDELVGDLDDQIAWEPFSKLPSEITSRVTEIFRKEETAYAEANIDAAKDWVCEHRHEKKDRDNLAEVFRSAFARDADEVSINFHPGDFSVHISGKKRVLSGGKVYTINNSRYLSDAEIVEVWEAETSR